MIYTVFCYKNQLISPFDCSSFSAFSLQPVFSENKGEINNQNMKLVIGILSALVIFGKYIEALRFLLQNFENSMQ